MEVRVSKCLCGEALKVGNGELHTCTYSGEGLYNHPLVVVGACGCFKNIQENLLEENLEPESI